jgi:O6-methylguanine-DNA--protein-cysteine methyltransferase
MQQMGMGQGSMSSEQQAELGRLASQQGKVQKSLEELSKEQKEAGGSKKALGNLEKMAEEMKEILTDMQSGRVTDETRRRQDRILSRLLDASRSMNERDYEKTRESRSGENTRRSSPAELNLERLRNSGSVRDLLRSMQQGYTKDYEQIIRQYFEQLQQQK